MKLGIVGTGKIVQELLPTLKKFDLELFILSTKRSEEKSLKLKEKYDIRKIYFDYDEMLKSDIDVFYIALPNYLHFEFAKKALLNKKNIIIEKPMVTSLDEFNELNDLRKKNNLMMLEAMNIHHLPAFKELKKHINDIGKIKIASFNYTQYSSRFDKFKEGIIEPVFDYKKKGGSLMDINIYNIHAASGLFGDSKKAVYFPNIDRNIDTSGIVLLDYGDFKVSLTGSKDAVGYNMGIIEGEDGYIKINSSINEIDGFEICFRNNNTQTYKFNQKERLYYEFEDFIEIIKEKNYEAFENLLKISYNSIKVLDSCKIF